MESSAKTASDIQSQDIQRKGQTIDAGEKASSELGASRREMSRQQAEMGLKKLELQQKSMNVTPQIAVGLSRYLGPAAFQLIGPQDPHFVLGILHAQIQQDMVKLKAPKEFNFKVGDKTVPGVMHYNEDSASWEIKQLGEGGPTATPKGKGTDTSLSKADQKFMASQEKDAAFFASTNATQLKATNPDEWQRRYDTYKRNQDRYDKLRSSMGQGSGTPAPAPAAGGGGAAAAPGDAPFSADDFINEALKSQ